MPPKLPNLKFKPKTDTRVKEEVDDGDPELMSLVQRERLRQAQQAAQQQQQPPRTESAVKPESTSSGSRSSTSAPTRSSTGKAVATSNASRASAGGGNAALSGLSAPIPHHDPTADLPRDTLDAMMSGCDVALGEDHGGSSFLRPAALHQRRPGGSPMGTRNSSTDGSASASAAGSSGGTSGTDFLNAWRKETDVLRENGRAQFNVDATGTVAGGPEENRLLWVQLPRVSHELAPQLDLKSLPPGKVGQLRVHKSGRVTMIINDVVFEVACEDVGKDRSDTAMAQVAAAVLPPLNDSDTPTCFELGSVSQKMVCTPLF